MRLSSFGVDFWFASRRARRRGPRRDPGRASVPVPSGHSESLSERRDPDSGTRRLALPAGRAPQPIGRHGRTPPSRACRPTVFKKKGQDNGTNSTTLTKQASGSASGSASGQPRGGLGVTVHVATVTHTIRINKHSRNSQHRPRHKQPFIGTHTHAAHNNNPPHASNTQSHAPKSAAATRPTEGRARGCSVPNYWVELSSFFCDAFIHRIKCNTKHIHSKTCAYEPCSPRKGNDAR